jgi:hypothetical protein
MRRSRSALLHVSRPTAVGVLPAYMTCANCLVRPPAAPPVISICHCRARCSSSIIPTLLLPLPLRNKARRRRRRRPCAAGAAYAGSRADSRPTPSARVSCPARLASSRLNRNLGLFKFSLIQK